MWNTISIQEFDSPNPISSKPWRPLFNSALISLPQPPWLGAVERWRWSLLLLSAPHLIPHPECGDGRRRCRVRRDEELIQLWCGRNVSLDFGVWKWLKVKSLLSQQILSCLVPKWGSSMVAEISMWRHLPQEVFLVLNSLQGYSEPCSHTSLFCWRFSHHHIGLKMKSLPSSPQLDRKQHAMCSREMSPQLGNKLLVVKKKY